MAALSHTHFKMPFSPRAPSQTHLYYSLPFSLMIYFYYFTMVALSHTLKDAIFPKVPTPTHFFYLYLSSPFFMSNPVCPSNLLIKS